MKYFNSQALYIVVQGGHRHLRLSILIGILGTGDITQHSWQPQDLRATLQVWIHYDAVSSVIHTHPRTTLEWNILEIGPAASSASGVDSEVWAGVSE